MTCGSATCQPIAERVRRLHAKGGLVAERPVSRRQTRRQQLIVALVGVPVASVVRKHDNCPRSHFLAPTGATLSLEERRGTMRSLVLEHGANFRIVESDLESGRRDDNISVR